MWLLPAEKGWGGKSDTFTYCLLIRNKASFKNYDASTVKQSVSQLTTRHGWTVIQQNECVTSMYDAMQVCVTVG
jgi:hypothetical protein